MSKVLSLVLLTPLMALGTARALECEFPAQEALPTVARHVLVLDAAATEDPGLRSALGAYLDGIEGEVWLMGYGAGLRTRERLNLPAQRAEAARLLASLADTVAENDAAGGERGRHTAASLQQALSVLRRDPETLTRVLLVSGGEDDGPSLGMVPAARGFVALRGPLDLLDWVALGHAIPEAERAALTDGSVNLSVYPRGSVPELWRRPDLNPVLRVQRAGQLRLNTDSPFTVRVAADGSAVAAGGGALSLGRDQLPPGAQELLLNVANVQRLPENTPVLLCFDSAAGRGRQLLWLGSVPQVALSPGAGAALGAATPGVLSPGQLHALNPRAGTVLRRGRSVTLRYQVGEAATLTLSPPPPGWAAEVAAPQATPGDPGTARLRRGGTFAVRLRNVSAADETWTPLVTLRADSGATYALPLAVLQSPPAPAGRAVAALWLAGAALLGALLLLVRRPRPVRAALRRPAGPPRSSPLAAPDASPPTPTMPSRSGSAGALRARLSGLGRPGKRPVPGEQPERAPNPAPVSAPFRPQWLGVEGGAVLLGAEGARRTVAADRVGEQPGLDGLELLALGRELHLHRLPPGLGLRERGRPVRPGEALNPGRVYRLSEGERAPAPGRPQALLLDGETLHVYDALGPHSAALPPGRSNLGWLLALPELAGLQLEREAEIRLLSAPAELHPHRRDAPLHAGEALQPGVLYRLDPLPGAPPAPAPASAPAGDRLVVKPAAPDSTDPEPS